MASSEATNHCGDTRRMTTDLSSTYRGGIFRIGHRLHPGRMISVQPFLHRDVDHSVGRRAAVPMLFTRRNPDDIAGFDFAYRPAFALDPADPGDHVQRLAEGVRMPIRPRARLKGYAVRDNTLRYVPVISSKPRSAPWSRHSWDRDRATRRRRSPVRRSRLPFAPAPRLRPE